MEYLIIIYCNGNLIVEIDIRILLSIQLFLINKNMIKKFVLQFISIASQIIGYIPALVYGYIFSEYFTKYYMVIV